MVILDTKRSIGAVEALAIGLTISVWVLSIPFVPMSDSRLADFRVVNADVVTLKEGATISYPDGSERLGCFYLVDTFIQNLERENITLYLNMTRPKMAYPDFLFYANRTFDLPPLGVKAVGLIVSSGTYSGLQGECTGLLAPTVLIANLEISTSTRIHEMRFVAVSQLSVFIPLALVTSVALLIVFMRRKRE